MFDPSVGRWMSTDPIDFDAGDANLYRYVGNNPTNATDPSGTTFFDIVDYGQRVAVDKFGGGKIKFPDGKEGQVKVWKHGNVTQHHPPYIRDVANGIIGYSAIPMGALFAANVMEAQTQALESKVGPRWGWGSRDSIIIEYSGPHSSEIQIVQTLQYSVRYRGKGQKQDKYFDAFEYPLIVGNTRFHLSPNPNVPKDRMWQLDHLPDVVTAGPLLDRGNTRTFVDGPSRQLGVLEAFLDSKNEKFFQKELGGRKNLASAIATFHGDTFLVYKGTPIYKVSWESTAPMEVAGQGYPRFGNAVTGGGPNPKLEKNQIDAIKDVFPNQTVIKLK